MYRHYQIQAINDIYGHWRDNKRKVLLHLDTGAGKTVIFCKIIKDALSKGASVLLVVRGRKLIDQASERLEREGVDHGILMAGRKPKKSICQVASIDTLIARDLMPPADLIVIDEAHLATSHGYTTLIEQYKSAKILAVTATPYGRAPLAHLADVVVRPTSFLELVKSGFLVAPRYVAPTHYDLSSITVTKGDYNNKQLAEFMDDNTIYGDIIDSWKKYGNNKPTLIFCTSVGHARELSDRLNGAGIGSKHVEANTPEVQRQQIIDDFKQGNIKVITNVGIMGTGVDIPEIETIVMARPTKSENLYIQQAGRGTRPYPNKKEFTIIDHGNNVLRHGFIEIEREANLDKKKRAPREGAAPVKTCTSCFGVCAAACKECPNCGHEFDVDFAPAVDHATMMELQLNPLHRQICAEIADLMQTRRERKYHRWWVLWQIEEKYGAEIGKQYLPKLWQQRRSFKIGERYAYRA